VESNVDFIVPLPEDTERPNRALTLSTGLVHKQQDTTRLWFNYNILGNLKRATTKVAFC
jgi:hypothetical protein